MTKKVAKVHKCCQNIFTSKEMTKKVAKVHKSCQNISTSVGMTKKVAKLVRTALIYPILTINLGSCPRITLE